MHQGTRSGVTHREMPGASGWHTLITACRASALACTFCPQRPYLYWLQ